MHCQVTGPTIILNSQPLSPSEYLPTYLYMLKSPSGFDLKSQFGKWILFPFH